MGLRIALWERARSVRPPTPLLSAALAASVVVGMLATTPTGAEAGGTCDRVAATNGSDRAAGTISSPYRTMQRLVDSLSPGQTGCLRGGTYRESNVNVTRGGTRTARVTIRSYPGEQARLYGRLRIDQRATYVTVSQMKLDGENAPSCSAAETCRIYPSPVIYADHVTFLRNEVTNHHTAICFNAGSSASQRAEHLRITRNRIHDCGRLPRTNHDHGIYLQDADYARITHNVIYDNADRGIQLYPDSDHNRIAHNVIDGNATGVMFSGDYGRASSDNVVVENVITNSRDYNVKSWYPAGNPKGYANVARRNCLYGGGAGEVLRYFGGFKAVSNQIAGHCSSTAKQATKR